MALAAGAVGAKPPDDPHYLATQEDVWWDNASKTWAVEALERARQLTVEQQHQFFKRLHKGITDLAAVDAEASAQQTAAKHAAHFARRPPTGQVLPQNWVRSFDQFAIQAQLARIAPETW